MKRFWNWLRFKIAVVMLTGIDHTEANATAQWDDAQNMMETACKQNPYKLRKLARVFNILRSRAKERAEDIQAENNVLEEATGANPSLWPRPKLPFYPKRP